MSDMDPERLSRSGSSLVRDALDAERGDPGPDPARLRRIEAALEGAGPPGPPGGASSSRGGWVLGGVLGGAVLLAVGLAVTRTPASAPSLEPAAALAPIATETTPAPSAPNILPAPPPVATTLATPASPALEAKTPAAPERPSSSASTKTPAKVIPGASESEGDEMVLVARAQDALHGRPAEALALCREHERAFATGRFVQEREAIAIEALVYQKRTAEAERRWKSFERAYPSSSHRSHLAALFSPSVHANPGSATP